MKQIKTIKGTHDILPDTSKDWRSLEKIIHTSASLFGYKEIRTPIIEEARLFNRGIGENTDIVSNQPLLQQFHFLSYEEIELVLFDLI